MKTYMTWWYCPSCEYHWEDYEPVFKCPSCGLEDVMEEDLNGSDPG